MSQKNQTLEGTALRYAESCVKTGELLKDLASAFLDGYWTCQRDMLGSKVVPIGNRWWYYDAEVVKGGLYAAEKKKGLKIRTALKKFYGKDKGEQVF